MIAEQFFGTWVLRSYVSRRADGTTRYPFGQEPVGLLIYTANGYMSAQLMRPDRPPFSLKHPTAPDLLKGTSAEIKAALYGYIGYSGTYAIDEGVKTVTHHVQCSVLPHWVGRDLLRLYAFEDASLTLSTPATMVGGVEQVEVLVWERVK